MLDEGVQRLLFRELFGRDGSFKGCRLIYRSYDKLTYQLSVEPPEPDLVLQVWLLNEDAHFQGLRERFGSNVDGAVQRLWPYGARHVLENTHFLLRHGVKVPTIRAADDSSTQIPYSYVVYEYVHGQPIDRYEAGLDPAGLARLHAKVGDTLGHLHSLSRSWPGAVVDEPDARFDCKGLCFQQVLANTEHAAVDGVLRSRGDHILDHMQLLMQSFATRSAYHAAHGDIQLDHILVDEQGDVWFIDLELMKFFELEYEVCRFGMSPLNLTSQAFQDAYGRRLEQEIDGKRIRFYELYWLVTWLTFLERAVRDSRQPSEAVMRSKLGIEDVLKDKLQSVSR